MRVLVAGVGYRNLRDHSFGVAVTDRLATHPWPGDVVVEDLSYNPIAVGQWLQDEAGHRPFARAIVVAAVERAGRAPGAVCAYRWDGALPADDDVQQAVAEAVTGVIALDNTLIVGRRFGGWPDDIAVVEVEPAVHEFGDTFSPAVERVFERACALVSRLATDEAAAARLPRAALGLAPALDEAGLGEPPDLLAEIQRLITELETHADPGVRERVMALLQGIDAVHRTALTHLAGAIHSMAGEAFMNRLTADPAIRLLFMSYDLIAVDRRLHAEEALDTVRGHLHGHGIDVELEDVVGGAVYVKLHGFHGAESDLAAVRHDLEEALRAGLIGFQELVLGDRAFARGTPQLLQVTGLRRPHTPVYRRACVASEIPPGATKAVELDGRRLLLANVDGTVHAVVNQCGDTPLPLQFSTLEGAELRCSWHGCRYDVRTGARLDGAGASLAIVPVSVESSEVRVAVGIQPTPTPAD